MHWNRPRTPRGCLVAPGPATRRGQRLRRTPLSLACTNGSRDAVDAAPRRRGANPNCRCRPAETLADDGGADRKRRRRGGAPRERCGRQRGELSKRQTALMWAVSEKHAEVAGRDETAPMSAPVDSRRHPDAVRRPPGRRRLGAPAARHGADVNQTATDRLSPLVVATVKDKHALAIFLLDHGADPTPRAPCSPRSTGRPASGRPSSPGRAASPTSATRSGVRCRGVQSGKPELIEGAAGSRRKPDAPITKPPQRLASPAAANLIGAHRSSWRRRPADAELMRMLAANGAIRS